MHASFKGPGTPDTIACMRRPSGLARGRKRLKRLRRRLSRTMMTLHKLELLIPMQLACRASHTMATVNRKIFPPSRGFVLAQRRSSMSLLWLVKFMLERLARNKDILRAMMRRRRRKPSPNQPRQSPRTLPIVVLIVLCDK